MTQNPTNATYWKKRSLEAEANSASCLDLVSRIREALGDNGVRMQSELLDYCRELVKAKSALTDVVDGWYDTFQQPNGECYAALVHFEPMSVASNLVQHPAER